jgi:hypothetical protein
VAFNRAGKPAGYVRKGGHRYITLDGVKYRADRIAWKMMYGDPVPDGIEHINGDKADDRLANLRAKAGAAWHFTDEGNHRLATADEIATAEADLPEKLRAALARDA